MTTVPDLDAAIRAMFPVATTETADLAAPYNGLRDALLAVLDRHESFDNPQHPSFPWCGGCNDYYHLCPTRQAIAEKLGIEVEA